MTPRAPSNAPAPNGPHDPSGGDEFQWVDRAAPRAEVAAAIRKNCTGDLCPMRSASLPLRLLLSAALPLLIMVYALFLRSWHAGDDMSAGTMQAALGWSIVQVLLLAVAMGRGPGRRIPAAWRWACVGAVPVVFLVYQALVSHEALSWSRFVETSSFESIFGCELHAVACGTLVGIGMLIIWRRTDPLAPGLTGALAGLFAGITGGAIVGLGCPNRECWHLWLGHGLCVLALTGLGYLGGKRWLAP